MESQKNHVPNHQLVDVAVCQNLVPLVNIKIAGKWMFIPLKMVLIGIDPYPYFSNQNLKHVTSDSVSHNPVTAGFWKKKLGTIPGRRLDRVSRLVDDNSSPS